MTVHPFPHRVKTPPQGAARFFEYMRAIEASSLPMTERHIAITIARFAGDRVCYASNATLATACGCTPRTIQRATNSLVSAGWLDLTNKAGASNAYGIPASLPQGGDSVSPHDSVSPPPATLCHPPHDSVSQGGDSVSPYIPKTSPKTSPPLPSREGAHETTPHPATSQEDGMGGGRQDIKGDTLAPTPTPSYIPAPHMPSPDAPLRLPVQMRGERHMTPDELAAHLRAAPEKAKRALRRACGSHEAVAYLAATWTAYELTRALGEACKDATASPWVAMRRTLEGTWRCDDADAIERVRAGEPAEVGDAPTASARRGRYARGLHVTCDSPDPYTPHLHAMDPAAREADRAEGRRCLAEAKRIIEEYPLSWHEQARMAARGAA